MTVLPSRSFRIGDELIDVSVRESARARDARIVVGPATARGGRPGRRAT